MYQRVEVEQRKKAWIFLLKNSKAVNNIKKLFTSVIYALSNMSFSVWVLLIFASKIKHAITQSYK